MHALSLVLAALMMTGAAPRTTSVILLPGVYKLQWFAADSESGIGSIFSVPKTKGWWFGKISSSAGQLDVQVRDSNGNGKFNDVFTVDSAGNPRHGDQISIKKPPTGCLVYSSALYLAKTVLFDDRLYVMTVSEKGDTLEIQPYKGDAGALLLELRDGNNREVDGSTSFTSVSCGYAYVPSGKPVRVPPGDYQPLQVLAITCSGPQNGVRSGVIVRVARSAKVAADQTTVFKAGGPVTFDIVAGAAGISLSPGDKLRAELRVRAGEDELASVMGGASDDLQFDLRSASGAIVASGTGKLGKVTPPSIELQVPADCPLGDYTLTVTLDPGCYVEPITVRKPVKLLAHAQVDIVPARPEPGAELAAGTYKLEWRIPEPGYYENLSQSGWWPSLLKDANVPTRFVGVKSDRALYARLEGFPFIVDESQGTGSGYDTAYVVPVRDPGDSVDLKDAYAFVLTRSDDALQSEERTVELPVGLADASVSRPFAASVKVKLTPTDDKHPLGHASLRLRGGWYGKVKAGRGEMDIRALDWNDNGVFGELQYREPNGDVRPADAVLLNAGAFRFLAQSVPYEERLYSIKVSPVGDTIEIEPYSPRTATLRIEPRDPSGKALTAHSCFYSELGQFQFKAPIELVLPAGSHHIASVSLYPQHDQFHMPEYQLEVGLDRTIELRPGESATLKLGGPMRLEIEPGAKEVAVQRGSTYQMAIKCLVGDGELIRMTRPTPRTWQFNKLAQVNIRDARGNLLKSDSYEFSYQSKYSLTVPKEWRAGEYTIGVSYDPSSYDKPLFATKTLRVLP